MRLTIVTYLAKDFFNIPICAALELYILNFQEIPVDFEELTNFLSKASESYEHFIIMGDFNIDVTNRRVEFDKLDEFCDLYKLTNLILLLRALPKHINQLLI